MANRQFAEIQHIDKNVKIISGSFAPNGASAIVAANNVGRGYSVVRTSAGLYTLTLEDFYVGLVAHAVSLQLSVGAAKYAQLGDVNIVAGTNKTIQIRAWDIAGAAAADVAANANNRIHFHFELANSTYL